MSDNEETVLRSEQSFEELLRHAVPRPSPSAQDTAAARAAVREEWCKVTGKRRRVRYVYGLAAAATVVLAAMLTIGNFSTPVMSPVKVATIDTSVGPVYVLGEESAMLGTNGLSSISAGQTILTERGSTLGLTWSGGGSLRIDAGSRVLFSSTSRIELLSGRVYFDSMDGASQLVVTSPFGAVEHIGTQFMASVDADSLSVSVRDGRVTIDGAYFDEVVEERQRVTFRGSARAEVLNITAFGGEWEWIEATAPEVSFDGETLYRFLEWVAYETGFAIEFETTELEALARSKILHEEIAGAPRIVLDKRLVTMDLDYEFQFEEGVIRIIEREGR